LTDFLSLLILSLYQVPIEIFKDIGGLGNPVDLWTGFGELKNHYCLERLPFRSPEANVFRIMSKIMAMTLTKIFQQDTLPKQFHSLPRIRVRMAFAADAL
jgi:hypothetical protein